MRKGSREDGKKKKKKVKSWGTISSDKEKFLKKKFRGWQNHSALQIGLEQALSLRTMWVPVQWLLTTHNRVSIGGIFCFCRLRYVVLRQFFYYHFYSFRHCSTYLELGQWEYKFPFGLYRDGPSDTLLAPPAQEEKGCDLPRLQQ